MNKSYRCQIFSCLTQYDTIKSGTAVPLLLKFEPRMFGVYKVYTNWYTKSNKF